jgi:N-acetylglucosamine-6-phosphate deacetylase
MSVNDDQAQAGNERWLAPTAVFDGQNLLDGQALYIVGGQVVGLAKKGSIPAGMPVTSVAGVLSRGYFDIQVNGGGDVLLNTSPTPEAVRKIAAAHRKFGTTALLPTVITDIPEVTEAACNAVLEVHGQDGVMGVHIEGPHISLEKRGTHNPDLLRPLDETTIALVRRLRRQGMPVLITLAPEAVQPGQIQTLVDMGAVVSVGHSGADAQAVRALLAEGAVCFTHLFNAMSPMQSRAAGVTGAAINSDAYCSIICDGIHVSEEMVMLAERARPEPDRMILISDAMSTVGGRDHFDLYGQEIRLVDGKLLNNEGNLAGAHTTMAAGVERMVDNIGVPLETALRMALSNPARMMGLSDTLALMSAPVSDLVVINDDHQTRILVESVGAV